jgi:hypothetical protein
MDKISRAKTPDLPDQGLKNYGARQFAYAFVKRRSASPQSFGVGKSASAFVQCVCQNSYCVGSISCVGCVAELRKSLRTALSCLQLRPPQLRPASSSVASVLRPVACQLRSCASPNSMLSRMLRNSRRAATAMKVQRTAERLAHIVSQHQRALSELRQLYVPVGSRASSSSGLRPVELSAVSPGPASQSNLRPCELRPVASPSASSELSKRESPLRKFESVASQSAPIQPASANSVPVALLRPPKRSLH